MTDHGRMYENHFTMGSIQRDTNKAYFAYQAHALSSSTTTPPVISTGKWGCGAFVGTAAHKFVQQALAANAAGVDLDFSAFGDPESCAIVLNTLRECKATALMVSKALKACRNRGTFVTEFLNAILLQAAREESQDCSSLVY